MPSIPPITRCPVCDATLGVGPRAAIDHGFVTCPCCSHQVRRLSVVPVADGVLRVRGVDRDPSVARCDRRMTTIQELGLRSGHVLELGCGTGRFLLVARARGFEVAGIESDAARREAAREATGLPIAKDSTEVPGSQRFELIACWGALALVRAPLELLSWCAERMRPGAFLALSIPDPEQQLEPGTLHRFTLASLSLCALRAGFEILEPAHHAGPLGRWWRSHRREPELYARLR